MRIDLSRVAASAIDAALDDGKPQRGRLTGAKAIAAGAALALAARYAVAKAPHIPRIPGLSDLSSVPDRLRDHLPDDVHDMLADRGWLGDTDGARVDEEGFDLTDDESEGDEGGEPPDDKDDSGGPEAGEDLFADEPEDNEEPEAEEDEPDADDEPEADEEDESEEDDEPEDAEDESEEDEAEPDDSEDVPRDVFADEPDQEADDDEPEDEPRDLFADEPDEAAPDADSDGNLAADESDVPGVMDILSRQRRQRPVLTSRRRPRRRPRVDPAERPPEPPKRTSDDKSGKAKARKR